MKVAAGIVLYNPDKERFVESLQSIQKQVDKIFIFDNGSDILESELPPEVVYVTKNENVGLAYALNKVMEMADKAGYNWVITMDQDSVIPAGLVNAFKEKIGENKIGIICPQVIDTRRPYMNVKQEPKEEYIQFCITSASCTSVECWKQIGKFDEWLFVDLIDNDFCKRLISSGYKILRLNTYVLNQEFGKIEPKSEGKQRFWLWLSKILRNKNIAKFSYKKYVSPFRVYYTNRNIIYLNRKLKNYGPVGYRDNYNCNGYMGFLVCFCIPSLLRAQNKIKVLMAIINGMKAGMRAEVKEWKV